MNTAHTLNPTQLHLLKLFARDNSEAYAREIQEVLTMHFQKRLDEEAGRLWNEGMLSQEKLDETLFRQYLESWKSETQFLSSTKRITGHPSFRKIVDMGGNAIPLILKEIEQQPSQLVWALNAILHKKTGEGMTVTEACKQWIDELKKS